MLGKSSYRTAPATSEAKRATEMLPISKGAVDGPLIAYKLTGEAGKEILIPFPAEAMKIRAVSRRVNKPENNDSGLLEEGEMEQVRRLI